MLDATQAAAPDSERRPTLLFLCQTLPYPADGGAHLRTYNIMRLLSQVFDITALCFFRRATRPTPEAVERSLRGLREIAVVEAVPIPQEHSRVRLGWDHLRSAMSGTVYTRFAYDSSEFRTLLRESLASRDFDLVHVDSLDLATYLPEFDGIPVVCTHHNVESDLLRRRAGSATSGAVRAYLRLQSALMRREERRWSERVTLNVAVSRADAERFAEIGAGGRFCVVPNGVDTDYFEPGDGAATPSGLVFVGGYSWYPNRDAMAAFRKDVLPLILNTHPDVRLTWVGRAPDSMKGTASDGVHVTGYVDDVRPHVHAAACYVAPLRVGGGTRLKILDAWALGKAVVSTSVGCEGLEAKHGENILIADSPAEFAEAVRAVLDDGSLRQRLERGARATAERLYSWERIGEGMLREYLTLVQPIGASQTRSA